MEECRPGERGESGFLAGIFLVDKPCWVTSFSVVRQVRRLIGIKKVGHAGTLDPFASGLLVICAGRPATRLIERFMSGKKVYRAVAQLGVETDTMDPEGKAVSTTPVPDLTDGEIQSCLERFTGCLKQVPPAFSAVKYKGKPLYHYARKGIEIIKEPRDIEIFSLVFSSYDAKTSRLAFEVTCSRGTYIRVLAADIGRQLGCGAHLVELRRLGSGVFSVTDSLPGDDLSEPDGLKRLMAGMIPVDQILTMLGEQDEESKKISA